MTKLLLVLAVIVAILYGIYGAAVGIWGYLEVSGLVDRTVDLERPHIVDVILDGPAARLRRGDETRKIRTAIVKGVAETGVPVDPEDIVVTSEGATLQVRVKWLHPMVTFRGEPFLPLPITLFRSYDLSRPVGEVGEVRR